MSDVAQPLPTNLNRHQRPAAAARARREDDSPEYRDEVLRGVREIAEYLGEDERRVQYLLSRDLVPGAYQIGSRWELRPSTHRKRIAELENA
jgi:hypothetical protein